MHNNTSFFFSQREKEREGYLDLMINANFIKQSPTANEIMATDSERVETTQESDDEMRINILYSPEESSGTQSIIVSDGQENNKKNIDIMFPSLTASRAKISDRNATYLLTAVIDALELDANNYNISWTVIRRGRISARSKIATQIREDLQAAPSLLVVHWDGKLLSDLTGQATVDRLPVLISRVGTQQLLSDPKSNRSR